MELEIMPRLLSTLARAIRLFGRELFGLAKNSI